MAKFKLRREPSRPVTGTSYESQGTNPNTPVYDEQGSSAVARLYDVVPELGSPHQARQIYTKMARSDVSVRVGLRAGKAPCLGADYYVEPASDAPEDILAAELCEYNFFGGMTVTWLKFLEQVLHMFEEGFEPAEPVWELREWSPKAAGANRKKYTMLRKLAIRPANTVSEITYDDNGGPTGIIQNAIREGGKSEPVTIPINKLVIFTFDQEGGNLEGNSILRSAYENWYYKTHLYKIDAIQKERHGIGMPEIELQPGYSEADRKVANELGRNLRTNERGYIVRTTFLKVGFAELSNGGAVVNCLHSINHHDDQIMKNIMVQFLNMGVTEGGGNRATSATSMDMFLKAMRYISESICDAINMYVIPNLVTYNFKTNRFPKLCVRNIGETKDMQTWASAMSNLIDKGGIQVDDETEQWIRKIMQMPRRNTPYIEAPAKEDNADPNKKADPSKNGNGSGNFGATKGNVGKPTDQAPVA